MKIYVGYDPREALGTWVFMSSVMRRSARVDSFTPLTSSILVGTNAFTYQRFLAPAQAGYRGDPIVFVDGADMICLTDINEIKEHYQLGKALHVVKRPEYIAATPKYVGTEMEAPNKSYPRKNWSSVMLMAPGHYAWRRVDWGSTDPAYWMEFGWLQDSHIGELPDAWNRLVDEGDPVEGGKILHWTLGVPSMKAYENSPGADLWREEAKVACRLPAEL